jgi:hypothetical protein
MKPILRRGNETAILSSRRVDLAGYGYSNAKANEPLSGDEIRGAYPVRFDASFLRRERERGRRWRES